MVRFVVVWLMVIVAAPVWAVQRVEVQGGAAMDQGQLVDAAYSRALVQEVLDIAPALEPKRVEAVAKMLSREEVLFILGYSVCSLSSNATQNATVDDLGPDDLALDVHTNRPAIRQRLVEMGVVATQSRPKPYVLSLIGVDPSGTGELGRLQILSGLKPVPASSGELPVLRLTQHPPGAWTGTLLLAGGENATLSDQKLEKVWFGLWKDYFTQFAERESLEGAVQVRVTGWLSSMGPMDFDRLMETWPEAIESKTLAGVEMEPQGLTGVWTVKPRDGAVLRSRLRDAAASRGLTVEIR